MDVQGHPTVRRDVWVRGLQMLVLRMLFGPMQAVLFCSAVLQFGWMLLAGRRNDNSPFLARALPVGLHWPHVF